MAQKTCSAHKKLTPGFANELKLVTLEYDFAVDGGATTDTYVMGTVDEGKVMVHSATVRVKTTATSGGSATAKIGVNGGDDDAFLDVTSGAVASLAADYTEKETAGQKIVIADGGKIEMVIGTAALTAGKIALDVVYSGCN